MAEIWSKYSGYSICRKYVDAMVRRAYRKIKVEGFENIPSDGAVIIAPNHCNTLMDALVILQSRKAPTAFGARADIFRKPKIAAILKWLRIVPLARSRDSEYEREHNMDVFSEVVECINHDVPFVIFVEGTHHVGYTVHSAHLGVFKLADLSKARYPGNTVRIVPAGLVYEDFYDFRSRVALRYGKPIELSELEGLTPGEKIEKLTARIQELVKAPEKRKHGVFGKAMRWALSVILAPLFLAAAIAALPVWAVSEKIVKGLKDKAWSNTVRFGVAFALLPILTILLAAPLFVLLPWGVALAGLVWLWCAPYAFYQMLYDFKRI